MTRRVFVDAGADLRPDTLIVLNRDESHYLIRVRRAAVDDDVELLDLHGPARFGRIVGDDAQAATIRVGPIRQDPPIPSVRLGLALIEPKAGLDALSRACEGGAESVIWIDAHESHGRPPSAARCERVLRAAMRQCGRPTPPRILGPVPLEAFLEGSESGWIASINASSVPVAAARLGTETNLLIGPEGGWTTDEENAASKGGFSPISLGPWILRTEVAVSAALARVLAESHKPMIR